MDRHARWVDSGQGRARQWPAAGTLTYPQVGLAAHSQVRDSAHSITAATWAQAAAWLAPAAPTRAGGRPAMHAALMPFRVSA